MKYDQSNSGDQFGADDDDREEISGAFSQPWRRFGRGTEGCEQIACFHVISVLIPMQGILILTRNGPEPENATTAAFGFRSGNGSVMHLVASAGINIFADPRYGASR